MKKLYIYACNCHEGGRTTQSGASMTSHPVFVDEWCRRIEVGTVERSHLCAVSQTLCVNQRISCWLVLSRRVPPPLLVIDGSALMWWKLWCWLPMIHRRSVQNGDDSVLAVLFLTDCLVVEASVRGRGEKIDLKSLTD